jgi:predicted metal-dependent hydrolase
MEPRIVDLDIRESSKESYTNNKETIYICTKDPKTKLYYSDNTLIYVLLHELAHMKDHQYNPHHDEKFKEILENLLLKAESYGLYNPNQGIPSDYCGLN